MMVKGLKFKGLDYDESIAKQMLDKIERQKFYFLSTQSESIKDALQRVQQQVKPIWGFTPEIRLLEWKVYLDKVKSMNEPIVFLGGWLSLYPDPISMLVLYTSESESNTTGWASRAYDRLLKQIQSLPLGEERNQLIDKALHHLIEEDVAIVPVLNGKMQVLVKPFLKDFPVNPMERLNLWQVDFK